MESRLYYHGINSIEPLCHYICGLCEKNATSTCPGISSLGHSAAAGWRKEERGHFESAIKQAQIERVRGERGRGEVKEVECVRMGFEIFSWTGYRSGPATTKRRHGIKLFEMIHLKAKWKVESATENFS